MRIPIFSSSNKPKQNQRSSPNLTSSSELGFHRPTHNGVILNSAQFPLRRISTTILCTISRLEGLQREHTAPANPSGHNNPRLFFLQFLRPRKLPAQKLDKPPRPWPSIRAHESHAEQQHQ